MIELKEKDKKVARLLKDVEGGSWEKNNIWNYGRKI